MQQIAPVLLFDVNETLVDLGALDPEFEKAFGSARLRLLWFEHVLHTSLIVNELRQYIGFSEICRSSLEYLTQVTGMKPGLLARKRILQRIKTLPPHPDVPGSLKSLSEHGFRIAALSNGSSKAIHSQLKHAGISAYFEQIVSTDEVKRFKPAPEPYLHAARRLGVPIRSICLVAAHSWDVSGASRAGAQAALIRRSGSGLNPLLPRVDLEARDLGALSRKLVGMRRASARGARAA